MDSFVTGQVVHHVAFGTGRVVNAEDGRIVVNFIKGGVRTFTQEAARAELSETPFEAEDKGMDIDALKEAVREVILEQGLAGGAAIAEKWAGGELVMRPGRPGLQEKSVPIDAFFHKVVMIRNQLRLLEQNVNSSRNLTDAEKVEMQQYVTRCYGSLTTFNALFADREDWFVGSKKDAQE